MKNKGAKFNVHRVSESKKSLCTLAYRAWESAENEEEPDPKMTNYVSLESNTVLYWDDQSLQPDGHFQGKIAHPKEKSSLWPFMAQPDQQVVDHRNQCQCREQNGKRQSRDETNMFKAQRTCNTAHQK